MGYNIIPIYNFLSKYKFGLAYFDEKGRTNGVVTNTHFDVSTPPFDVASNGDLNVPRITFDINHRPPVWATSYQWVRTKNLALLKFLYWVSESTYKDNDFAYIGIQNLYQQKEENEKTILSYDFTPGDRVRFIKIPNGAVLANRDYEIKEFVNNPEINGTTRNGYFIKIKLPATDPNFDFGIATFRNYLINLYTNAPLVDNNLNVFYEFGEAYNIGDAGLASRYHFGKTQDQTPNATQPAKFVFTKGDVYIKSRKVDLGAAVRYSVSGEIKWGLFLFDINFLDDDVGNPTYRTGNSSVNLVDSDVLLNDDKVWILKTGADAYTFDIKGQIKINIEQGRQFRMAAYIVPQPTPPIRQQIALVPLQYVSGGDTTFNYSATVTIPPNSRLYIIGEQSYISGAPPLRVVDGTLSLTNTANATGDIVDANFSDTFLSSVNSNGRPLVIDETGETYNPTLVRWSEAYQAGTNINNTNRFYPLNYDEYDRAKGDIRRLKVRASLMHVLQARGCGSVPIFQQILSNADGSANLMQSDKIINKIRYYQGEYGMGNQPASLASSAGADYFSDPVRGYQCRLAGDGITPISELYKAQFYLPPVLRQYLSGNFVNAMGSRSRILGSYDFFNEEFVTIFQATIGTGETLAFDEKRNAYTSFYDIEAESILCAGTTMMTWRGGKMYMHDAATRNTFYGIFYPSIIDRVINMNANVKKEFMALGYNSDSEWTSPVIATEMRQASNLIAADYELREGMYTAPFLRDTNSVGGLIDGDFLKGVWCEIRLLNNKETYQYLYGLYVNFLISQKNF